MDNNTLNDNSNLLKALQKSALSDKQKKEFAELLEEMSETEKVELMNLIETSHREKANFESQKIDALAQLNSETEAKIKQVDQEENKLIREETEKFDQKETEVELKAVEENIENVEEKEKPMTNQNLPKNHLKTGKFFLILLALLVLVIILIYGLLNL